MIVDSKTIGQKIKQRRRELGISQETLGELIGVTYQQIQKYEKGKNKVSADRLSRIARALDVPVSFFFEDAGDSQVADKPRGRGYKKDRIISVLEEELLEYFRLLPDRKTRANLVGFLRSVVRKRLR